jgi:hypothetical protein
MATLLNVGPHWKNGIDPLNQYSSPRGSAYWTWWVDPRGARRAPASKSAAVAAAVAAAAPTEATAAAEVADAADAAKAAKAAVEAFTCTHLGGTARPHLVVKRTDGAPIGVVSDPLAPLPSGAELDAHQAHSVRLLGVRGGYEVQFFSPSGLELGAGRMARSGGEWQLVFHAVANEPTLDDEAWSVCHEGMREALDAAVTHAERFAAGPASIGAPGGATAWQETVKTASKETLDTWRPGNLQWMLPSVAPRGFWDSLHSDQWTHIRPSDHNDGMRGHFRFWHGRDETDPPTPAQLEADVLGDTWLTIYASAVLAGEPCGVIFPLRGAEPCIECSMPIDRILVRENPVEPTSCYDLTGISVYEVLLYTRAMPRTNADGSVLLQPVPVGVLELRPVFVPNGYGAGGRKRMSYAYHEAAPKVGVQWFPREAVRAILRAEHGEEGEDDDSPLVREVMAECEDYAVEDEDEKMTKEVIARRIAQYPPCCPRLLALIEMCMWERRFRVPDAVI